MSMYGEFFGIEPEDSEKRKEDVAKALEGFDQAFKEIGKTTEEWGKTVQDLYSDVKPNQAWHEEALRQAMKIPYQVEVKGPSPSQSGYCGFCATTTDKQRKKLDSCPSCGKSYFKYGRR